MSHRNDEIVQVDTAQERTEKGTHGQQQPQFDAMQLLKDGAQQERNHGQNKADGLMTLEYKTTALDHDPNIVEARWGGGYGRGYGGYGGSYGGWGAAALGGLLLYEATRPRYYAPPPVYYEAPPPVYYEQPRYYDPQPGYDGAPQRYAPQPYYPQQYYRGY